MEEPSTPANAFHTFESATLYVSNIGEKLGRASRFRRHTLLDHVFSRYGKILKIYSRRSLGLRGHAWIIFNTKEEAIEAKKNLDGYKLTEKGLKISYAKSASDITLKRSDQKDKIPQRAKHSLKPNKNKTPVRALGPSHRRLAGRG